MVTAELSFPLLGLIFGFIWGKTLVDNSETPTHTQSYPFWIIEFFFNAVIIAVCGAIGFILGVIAIGIVQS